MTSSLAGTWGLDKKKEMKINHPLFGATTNKEMFGDQHIKKHKEDGKHTLAKFRRMKEAETMILTYSDTNVHAKHSQAWTNSEDDSENAPDPMNGLRMSRTFEKVMKMGDAPVAVGRSGARVDVGINASGLLGERLMVSDEPSRNTFVQRAWLPHDDPSLGYKVNGVPKAHMPNDVSLNLGEHSVVKAGWAHAREAIFTGDAMSKVGARRAGVFLDEKKADGSGLVNP